jgi:uncharacterized RDD family membrane protein YckC
MTLQTFCPNCGAALIAGAEFCGSCGARVSGAAGPTPSAAAAGEYAGFWIRLVASIIDGIILNVIGLIFGLVLEGIGARILIGILVGIAYSIGFWVANNGQTPGKMAVGIRVQMENGEPIDIGPALLRYVGYYVSAIILFIGFIMIAFTPQKRGLHDYIAGTVVVKARP